MNRWPIMPHMIPIPSSHAYPPVETSADDLRVAHVRMTRLLVALLTLGIMLALKRHYSLASADQLTWILAPTARLVAWLTPAHPVFEHGVGHVDFSQGIIIAPACAGINFMIMAFGLAVCCGLLHMSRLKELLVWMILSMAAAYAGTLLINTLRIAISMGLYRMDIYTGWLTVERLHRITGVGLYLGALWLFYTGVNLFIQWHGRPGNYQRQEAGSRGPTWLPVAWYLTGTVGVPVANTLIQQRPLYLGEHGITLIVTSLLLWGVASWAGRRLKIQG